MAVTADRAKMFVALQDWLHNSGIIPVKVLPWATAQAMFESTWGTSNTAKQDRNYSGIKWLNKPFQKATKGINRPVSEGGQYARFASPSDWARDFARILQMSPNRPVDATSLMDYVARLKRNGYFASSEAAYYKGLKSILDSVQVSAPIVQKAKEEQRAKNLIAESDHYKKEAKRLADKANWGINLDYKTWSPVTWAGVGLLTFLVIRRS